MSRLLSCNPYDEIDVSLRRENRKSPQRKCEFKDKRKTRKARIYFKNITEKERRKQKKESQHIDTNKNDVFSSDLFDEMECDRIEFEQYCKFLKRYDYEQS